MLDILLKIFMLLKNIFDSLTPEQKDDLKNAATEAFDSIFRQMYKKNAGGEK